MARFWGSTLWVAGAADVFTAGKTSQAEVHRTDGGSKEEAKRGRSTRSRLERWVRGEGSILEFWNFSKSCFLSPFKACINPNFLEIPETVFVTEY